MPQLIFKNVTKENYVKLAKPISERVAAIIDVPVDYIVAEYSGATFIRGGEVDEHSAMVWISWKKRTPEMQAEVAEAIADELFRAGYDPVEVVYDNLDMNDFYEFKKKE